MPLAAVLAGSFLLACYRNYVYFPGKETVYSIISAIFLFILGGFFNDGLYDHGSSFRKIYSLFMFTVLLLCYMGIISVPVISVALDFLGITQMIYYCLFVYCGFVFFS